MPGGQCQVASTGPGDGCGVDVRWVRYASPLGEIRGLSGSLVYVCPGWKVQKVLRLVRISTVFPCFSLHDDDNFSSLVKWHHLINSLSSLFLHVFAKLFIIV